MNKQEIDIDAFKKRGFLKSKDDFFVLRTRMPAGNYGSVHLSKMSEIAEKYGKGTVHLTVRQGIEVPYIRFEDIEKIEKEIKKAGIQAGTSGPRLRATTSCPGNNWCKRGLIDTFSLFERIEKECGIKCAMDLPHKFKIVISGCPNSCTRVQASEIGIHGEVDISHPEKRIGYRVYLGGCGGRTPSNGVKLDKVFTEEEVLLLIGKVVNFYKENAKKRQRFALLIEEIGRESFLKAIGIY
jgi:anaerobic sulfite reductase subunit C